MESRILQWIATTQLCPDVDNVRTAIELASRDNLALAASMRANGVLQPLLVSPAEGDSFLVVDGNRRFSVGLSIGINQFLCSVLPGPITVADKSRLQLVANLHRSSLKPLDLAVAFQELMATRGLNQTQLATLLQLSKADVTRVLRIAELPSELVTLVAQGKLPKSVAALLASVKDPEQQKAIADRYIAGSLDRDAVAEIVKQWRDGKTSPVAKSKAYRFSLDRGTITAQLTADCTAEGFIDHLKSVITAIQQTVKQGLELRHAPDVLKGLRKSAS